MKLRAQKNSQRRLSLGATLTVDNYKLLLGLRLPAVISKFDVL